MKIFRCLLLIGMVFALVGHSDAQNSGNDSRPVSSVEPYSAPADRAQIKIRVQNRNFWVNGNKLAKEKIPPELQTIHPDYQFHANVMGNTELPFHYRGRDYLIRAEGIVPMPPRQGDYEELAEKPQNAESEYYSNLKRESPNLFYSMNREANLNMQARVLVRQYVYADEKEKNKIREELRTVLDQLFDINEANRRLEIEELEQMIDVAKDEVRVRHEKKDAILDGAVEELLGE